MESRVRERALQTMVQATSQARITRAMRTRTVIPGEELFELDDEVEYHRPSAQKDVPGCHGPAAVIGALSDQGQVVIRRKENELRCRFQDVRQFIGATQPELQLGSTQEAFEAIRMYIEAMRVGSSEQSVCCK